MKTKYQKPLLAAALACALGTMTAYAQTGLGANRPFTLAPADAASGSGAAETPAQDQEADLAKKLNNPVAALISVPIQNNWDFGIGPASAMKYTCNIQPVVPIGISDDWNLILRTIMPVIYQEALDNNPKAPASARESHSGLGDITQSFFFSPKAPVGGWILGAGPVAYYPTATESELGQGKLGFGPTVVALQQKSGFTYGVLANHIWSVTGWGPNEVNATFIQPFVSYTTKTYTTFGINTESTYNWRTEESTVPMNFTIQQLVKIGGHPIAFQLGYRYYVEKPDGGPDWGLRFAITLLFPKKG
jgi:hypothetical protein